MSFKERIKRLKTKVSQVYIAMKSPKTPFFAKIVSAITVCYALSPLDLVPDFIPILGYLDDLIILPLLILIIIKLIPKDIWDSFEEEAKRVWKDGKPKKWYLAIPIIIIWLIIIGVVIWLIYK